MSYYKTQQQASTADKERILRNSHLFVCVLRNITTIDVENLVTFIEAWNGQVGRCLRSYTGDDNWHSLVSTTLKQKLQQCLKTLPHNYHTQQCQRTL